MFHIFGVGIANEHAAVNGPGRGDISPVEQMPTIHGLSIEQQGPAFFFFLVGKYIFVFRMSGTSEYESRQKVATKTAARARATGAATRAAIVRATGG